MGSIEIHPPIQIVDEADRVLRGGTMDEAQAQGLWHRIVRVMVYDPRVDRFLLQKVRQNPYYNGGLWNTSASGHVDEGESYEKAAIRELDEEMGIRGLTFARLERQPYQTEAVRMHEGQKRIFRRHNLTLLAVVANGPIAIRPDETGVESTWWASKLEIRAMVANPSRIVTDGLRHFAEQHMGRIHG